MFVAQPDLTHTKRTHFDRLLIYPARPTKNVKIPQTLVREKIPEGPTWVKQS